MDLEAILKQIGVWFKQANDFSIAHPLAAILILFLGASFLGLLS